MSRGLQSLLGYTNWWNFLQVVKPAKVACDVAGHGISDHLVDANKMVSLGSCNQREMLDMILTPRNCAVIQKFLTSKNGF